MVLQGGREAVLQDHLEYLVKCRPPEFLIQQVWAGALEHCISDKFPGSPGAAGLGATL